MDLEDLLLSGSLAWLANGAFPDGLSTRLLEGPHHMAAGFPQRKWSQKDGARQKDVFSVT